MWVVRDDVIQVIPLPDQPWASFRGAGRGRDYLSDLEDLRKEERERERGKSS